MEVQVSVGHSSGLGSPSLLVHLYTRGLSWSTVVHHIIEYGSTTYNIGMAPKKNGYPIVCVQSDMFKTLPKI